MWRYSSRHDATLADIANQPSRNIYRNFFAVIVEKSEPQVIEAYDKVLTRLKIVDQTFNFSQKTEKENLKFHKFAIVNIYSDNMHCIPQFNQIGDILRMYFARFFITQKGELCCCSDEYCDWRIYSRDGPENRVPISRNPSPRRFVLELPFYEKNYLKYICDWSDSFLKQNLLKDILWWNSYKSVQNKKPDEQKNIDLIVKCSLPNEESKCVEFKDKYSNKFTFEAGEDEIFEENKFYKIGGVNAIASKDKKKAISLTRTRFTGFFSLPETVKDAANFSTIFSQKNMVVPKKKAIKKPVYESDNKSHQTLLKKPWLKIHTTDLAEVCQCLEEPHHWVGTSFVIEGRIVFLSNTSLTEIAKRFIPSNGDTYDYESHFLKNLDSYISFIFRMDIGDENDEQVPVYVCTRGHNSSVFDNWEILPPIDDIDAWRELKKTTIAKFDKRFEQLLKKNAQVKVVVKLMMTKLGKPFYQMCDTVFK